MGGKSSKEEQYKTQDSSFFYKQMVARSKVASIEPEYQLLDLLGKGTFAEVFRAKSSSTQQIRAIKKVEKSKSGSIERLLNNEFQILKNIDHPNIIKIYGLQEDANHFYIISELIPGKELFDYFKARQKLTEKEVFTIFHQLLLALNHLHANHVMHRDIKLENIIYDEATQVLKLVDFGSAYDFDSEEPANLNCVGTPTYLAPEVIKKFYNHKCDNWSLGVFLFLLLAGYPPFAGKDQEDTFSKIVNEPLAFAKPVWESVSGQAKDLIRKLLEKNPEKRLSLRGALEHPWTQKHRGLQVMGGADQQALIEIFEQLRVFKELKLAEIQLGVLVFMVNFIVAYHREDTFIRCFHWIDSQGDGVITESELVNAMVEYEDRPLKKATEEVAQIMKKIDLNNSKDISYSEFMVAATDLRQVLTDQHLEITFSIIDTDRSGKLSAGELKEKLGGQINESYYQNLINYFDSDKDGEISLQEFKNMMKALLK